MAILSLSVLMALLSWAILSLITITSYVPHGSIVPGTTGPIIPN